ncbi:putative serine/threonine-protein kinase, active [Septoria linicola]|nr:putative serine/threonine-protein kinase, active [Septoria linicola]
MKLRGCQAGLSQHELLASSQVFEGKDIHNGQLVAAKKAADNRVEREIKAYQLLESLTHGRPCKYVATMVGHDLYHDGQWMLVVSPPGKTSPANKSFLQCQVWGQPERENQLAFEAAKGLDELHSLGMVHRDFKPGNLILRGDGHVKIIDLDTATNTLPDSFATTIRVGTSPYMAPEVSHIQGLKYAAKQADLWAFGVVMLWLMNKLAWFQEL